MRVYNLTQSDMDFRGQVIPRNGGFKEYDLTWVPPRDQLLADKGKLSFGSLPAGWAPKVDTGVVPVKPVTYLPKDLPAKLPDPPQLMEAIEVPKVSDSVEMEMKPKQLEKGEKAEEKRNRKLP